MLQNLEETLRDYQNRGAPGNQTILVALLKELQQQEDGGLSRDVVAAVAQAYGLKETLLMAVIKRVPSLRLAETHCLEICGGSACGRGARLGAYIRKRYGEKPEKFEWHVVSCLHMCGSGPNIRWDGVLYSGADEALIRSLVEGI